MVNKGGIGPRSELMSTGTGESIDKRTEDTALDHFSQFHWK